MRRGARSAGRRRSCSRRRRSCSASSHGAASTWPATIVECETQSRLPTRDRRRGEGLDQGLPDARRPWAPTASPSQPDGTPKEIRTLVHEEPHATDAKGVGFFRWQPDEGGLLRDRLRGAATASSSSPPARPGSGSTSPARPYRDFAFANIELIPDQRTFEPGQTAKILVKSALPEGTVFYSIDAGQKMLRYDMLALDGKLGVIEIPIERGHVSEHPRARPRGRGREVLRGPGRAVRPAGRPVPRREARLREGRLPARRERRPRRDDEDLVRRAGRGAARGHGARRLDPRHPVATTARTSASSSTARAARRTRSATPRPGLELARVPRAGREVGRVRHRGRPAGLGRREPRLRLAAPPRRGLRAAASSRPGRRSREGEGKNDVRRPAAGAAARRRRRRAGDGAVAEAPAAAPACAQRAMRRTRRRQEGAAREDSDGRRRPRLHPRRAKDDRARLRRPARTSGTRRSGPPRSQTDAVGHGDVKVPFPESLTTWRAKAWAWTPRHARRPGDGRREDDEGRARAAPRAAVLRRGRLDHGRRARQQPDGQAADRAREDSRSTESTSRRRSPPRSTVEVAPERGPPRRLDRERAQGRRDEDRRAGDRAGRPGRARDDVPGPRVGPRQGPDAGRRPRERRDAASSRSRSRPSAASETTALELSLQPSLALMLLDALPYLVDFPYGCTEQTDEPVHPGGDRREDARRRRRDARGHRRRARRRRRSSASATTRRVLIVRRAPERRPRPDSTASRRCSTATAASAGGRTTTPRRTSPATCSRAC